MDKDEVIDIVTNCLNTYTGLPFFTVIYSDFINRYKCMFDDGMVVVFECVDLDDYEFGDLVEQIYISYLEQSDEFGMGTK